MKKKFSRYLPHYEGRLLKLFLLLSCCSAVISDDSFSEEMMIRELNDGNIYSHFQFTTFLKSSAQSEDFHHLRLFPKAIGEIIDKFKVQELHLSMTQGYWRHGKWGYPLVDAPPGAELWAWFKDSTGNVDEMWNGLTESLAGQFCTYLNFMDSKSVVVPRWSFRPAGIVTPEYGRLFPNNVRYSLLPREVVCTENLTPWKKLLPCGSMTGLASLLNAIQLYSTAFHSLGIHFRPACKKSSLLSGVHTDGQCSDSDAGIELMLSLSVVFDSTVLRLRPNPNAPLDWTLRKLFGRMITSSCDLASVSAIYLDLSNIQKMTLSPQPSRILHQTSGSISADQSEVRYSVMRDSSECSGRKGSCLAVYDIEDILENSQVLSVGVKHDPEPLQLPYSPLLTVTQFLTGSGRYKGGIMCLLHNNAPDSELLITYQATLPWYLRLYLHTLHVDYFNKSRDTELNPHVKVSSENVEVAELKPALIHYVPGKDRQKSYQLELALRLPPHSVTRISYGFEQALLRWTEYPPDANHGFYIPSAVISTRLPPRLTHPHLHNHRFEEIISHLDSLTPQSLINQTYPQPLSVKQSSSFLRLYSECLLVSLPTPDFSMPYNVICLTCTVMAILFGSLHNLTTRKFIVLDLSKKPGLITKVKTKLSAIKAKFSKAKPADS